MVSAKASDCEQKKSQKRYARGCILGKMWVTLASRLAEKGVRELFVSEAKKSYVKSHATNDERRTRDVEQETRDKRQDTRDETGRNGA